MDKELSYVEPDHNQAYINISHFPKLLIRAKEDLECANNGQKKRKNNPHRSAVICQGSE